MNIMDSFPTRFISARDLEKANMVGKPFVIAKVDMEKGVHPKTRKESELVVVYFRGGTKGFRFRKSQRGIIAKGMGEDTDTWVGKTVKLITVHTQVGKGVRLVPEGVEIDA